MPPTQRCPQAVAATAKRNTKNANSELSHTWEAEEVERVQRPEQVNHSEICSAMTHGQTLKNSPEQSQGSLPHINTLALLFPAQQILEFVLTS